jgi:hypothetical protein
MSPLRLGLATPQELVPAGDARQRGLGQQTVQHLGGVLGVLERLVQPHLGARDGGGGVDAVAGGEVGQLGEVGHAGQLQPHAEELGIEHQPVERGHPGAGVGGGQMPDVEQGVVADQRGVGVVGEEGVQLGEHGGDVGLAGEVGGADAVVGAAVLVHRHARVGQPVKGVPAGAVEQHDGPDRDRVEGGRGGPGRFRVVVSMSRTTNSRPATSSR